MVQKILIVEDDEFLGDVLAQKLRGYLFEVVVTRDGADGLKKILEWKPDLVLLDIILPTMNGYEILEAKAKDATIKNIPVIVISNSGQPVELNRILALGVKDYIVKAQFDPNEVVAKVKVELGREKAEHSNGAITEPALEGRKVMWVEDDKFLSDIISRKLSGEKCVLIHSAEGEGALKLAEKEKPDIILLDILLPGIDGFEILTRLKANASTKNIPVILLSNLGQQSDVDKGEKLGAEKFLIKATVTLDEIISEMKAVIFRKKS